MRTEFRDEVLKFFSSEVTEKAICLCGDFKNLSYFKKNPLFQTIVQCQSCDLVYSQRQPTQEVLDKFYISPVMKIWENGKETLEEIKKQKEKYTPAIEYFTFENKIKSLLDVGCGNGWFLKWLTKANQKIEAIGLEISKGAYKKCKEKDLVVFNESLVDFSEAHSPDFWEENPYDAISLWGCLEHIKKPKKTIEIVSSFLKKDGYILVCVPNVDCSEVKKEKEKAYMFCPQHLWYFNEKTLNNFMTKMGFRLVFLYAFNNLYNLIAVFQKINILDYKKAA